MKCPYCNQPVKEIKSKKGPVKIIFHLTSCKPAREYDRKSKTYRIEREMPSVEHGGYL